MLISFHCTDKLEIGIRSKLAESPTIFVNILIFFIFGVIAIQKFWIKTFLVTPLLISFLTVLVFYLPSDSGEKVCSHYFSLTLLNLMFLDNLMHIGTSDSDRFPPCNHRNNSFNFISCSTDWRIFAVYDDFRHFICHDFGVRA